MLTGQTPEVYHALTIRERNAFIKIANKRARKARG